MENRSTLQDKAQALAAERFPFNHSLEGEPVYKAMIEQRRDDFLIGYMTGATDALIQATQDIKATRLGWPTNNTR